METADDHRGCSAAEQVLTIPPQHPPVLQRVDKATGPRSSRDLCVLLLLLLVLPWGARGHALPGAPGHSLQNGHVPALMASGSPLVL